MNEALKDVKGVSLVRVLYFGFRFRIGATNDAEKSTDSQRQEPPTRESRQSLYQASSTCTVEHNHNAQIHQAIAREGRRAMVRLAQPQSPTNGKMLQGKEWGSGSW